MSSTVRCACGQQLSIDEHHRAACSACGRWGYFAVIGQVARKVGPWHSSPSQPANRLPYADRG